MVKFSRGMWQVGNETSISWATEIVKSETKHSEALGEWIRAVASTKRINHRGDTLNNPTITFECSSPAPDTLHISAHHWKQQAPTLAGPAYELFPDLQGGAPTANRSDSVKATKTTTELRLASDTLSATFNTKPGTFNVDIRSHGGVKNPTILSDGPDQVLTSLGWRSVGYVKQRTNLDHPNMTLEDPDKGEKWLTMQFQLSVGEKIYGLGERFGPFVKNGQAVDMWNEDGGTSSELTYKNVPFYLSSRGYGIFVNSPGAVSFEIQSERTSRVNISVPFEAMSLYIIHGPTPASIIEKYTLITGRPALPPAWTFGLWLTTSFTTQYDEATVDHFLKGLEERDIALEVFHFDCFWMKAFQWCDFEFDADMFPDAKGQLTRLRDRGYKVCVWINPYIGQESKLFDEGVEKGYFIKKRDGSVWQFDWWQAGMAWVDFTNPDAWKWYKEKLAELVDLGVDCFKTDFGERIPTGNTVYFDGSNPDKMHNFYAYLYNKCTFEVLEEKKGKNEAVLFARSATAGGQRFPVHWGGDPMSTFEAMAETLRGGLSLGLCGFGYWAHDIGGFEGTPDPALYKRWFAFGALSSHSRLHGSGSFRVPWVIDESGEADRVLKHFTDLKLSLMPYLASVALNAHKTGVPVMRAMLLEFPEDPTAWNLDTQYMLGPNLLVAPVFSAEGHVRYYLPEGTWYGLLDGQTRTGPKWVTEKHDFMSLPLLLRPNSSIVRGNALPTDSQKKKSAVYDWADGVEIVVNGTVDEKIEVPTSSKWGEVEATFRVQPGKVTFESGALKNNFSVTGIDEGGKKLAVERKVEPGTTSVTW